MMTFEEAAKYLDSLADSLPPGIADGLNGGISLIPGERAPENGDGLSTLGMYFSGGMMGRYIELYYGSFVKLYGDRPRKVFERELKKTLYHELTHHVESMAGDRSLEREDERFLEEYEASLRDEALEVSSVLFVSFEDPSPAAMAEAFFRAACDNAGLDDIASGAAVYGGEGRAPDDAAVLAVKKYGLDISGARPMKLTRAALGQYDAVVCMTEDEGDELASLYPAYDSRIFAIGERDVKYPSRPSGYVKCAKELKSGAELLVADLLAEDENA